jgi:cellulose synthase operon protein C
MVRVVKPFGCAVVLVVLSCAPRVDPPTLALERAASHATAGTADAHELALAGFQALLMAGDAERARTWFDAALAKRADEPWALTGQMTLGFRTTNATKVVQSALDVCERAPRHPLAVVAARVVLDVVGQAKALDEVILARVPQVLAKLPSADAAHLLRAALVNAEIGAQDTAARERVLGELGMPTTATLVGPYSPWHHLTMGEATAPEKTGSLEALGNGPFGALVPRELRFADGRFALSGEPAAGDVYLFVVDLTVPAGGTYVLRTVTAMDHVAVLDGTTVITRTTWQRPASTVTARVVDLSAGAHRLVVRMARGNQAGHLTVALQGRDGQPAHVIFTAARGAAPRWSGVRVREGDEGLLTTASAMRDALVDEGGEALARFLAARDALGRDHDGAAALAFELPSELKGAMVSLLRADVALLDRTIPSRVGHGRANRELEAALAQDPGLIAARLVLAQLVLDDGRPLDAWEHLKQAKTQAKGAPSAAALALEARIQLALGLDASAASTAHAADAALAGHCDALLLEYDLARRRDAVAEADTLLPKTSHCAGWLSRQAEHARTRGRLDRAQQAFAALLAQDQSQAPVAITLSGLLSAQRKFDEALAVLNATRALWPRNTAVLKAMGDVFEQAGRQPEALTAREAALALDGGDLALRRAVERAKTGHELLDDEAISTAEALKSWEAAPGSEDATSTFVLDAAAIRAYPDGSMVDRIHIIQKALDQQGVQDIAEVQLPADAVVLTLRTLKPDGRTLEPETFEGKEGVSLPGVQIGDFVEYEYLLAHPSRGPGQPGFTASNFYFQIARQPNARSTYVVKADRGAGLKVDGHNVTPPKVVREGELEVFRHEERRVPPYIPEPLGPPSGNEWLPFVSVGAGEEGNAGVLRAYADAFADRGEVTWEVAAFAKKAAGSATGLEAARAVYAAVMDKLSGRDAGLGVSAAASVAQDRGSRTWLLLASLRALGLDARLAAVRSFTSDPAPYVFPSEGLLTYLCVHVALSNGQGLWLDPLVRYAPFNELPEFALGEREAWLLPEPGRPAQAVKTPPAGTTVSKTVTLTMSLTEEGVLSGSGTEVYSGFEAAQLAEALESIAPDQRDQALQGALSRYFGGADLSALKVDATRQVGGTVKVAYEFIARRFARSDRLEQGPGRLIAGGLTFPHMLGRRFLAVPARKTPLFIEGTETSHLTATLTLPKGWVLAAPEAEITLEGPNAKFVRTEKQAGAQVVVTEDFRLMQSRISPAQYEAFGQFSGEVDLVQQRDVLFEQH